MQSHLTQAFFTLIVRITFRAHETSSSCSALTSLRYLISLPHSGQQVSAGSSRCISRESIQGEGCGDGTGEAGVKPVDRYPDRCNDRFAAPAVSAGLQRIQPAGEVFQSWYRTASAAVFLSVPADALIRALRSRFSLRRGPAPNAGTTQSLQRG